MPKEPQPTRDNSEFRNPVELKKERLGRLFGPSGNTLIVALDDSSISGPRQRLYDMRGTIETAVEHEANAILGFPGMFESYGDLLGENTAGILNLTLSTVGTHHLRKVKVGRVKDADLLDVAGVSVHVNTTSPDEPEMLKTLGKTAAKCRKFGIPLLAHMYPRTITSGKEDHYQDLRDKSPDDYAELVAHAARIASDLGADIIKVPYTGSMDSFKNVVGSTYDRPVVMAGGPIKQNISTFLEEAYFAMRAGAKGIAVGRNYFQRPDGPDGDLVLLALSYIVHEGENPLVAEGAARLLLRSKLKSVE